MTQEQAQITLSQIGKTALIMIGAKQFSYGPKGMGFRVGRNSKNVNHILISLDADDTYTVTAHSIRGITITKKGEYSGVYCDQLNSVIESLTGMYTNLFGGN